MNSRARRLCCLTLSSFLFVVAPALASHVTVRPDGSGDYPTIQAAVDALTLNPPLADTLLLEPGHYDEIVNDYGFERAIWGRGGAGATRVKGFTSLPEQPREVGGPYGRIVGVTIDSHVSWGRNTRMAYWEDCVFAAGYDGFTNQGGGAPLRHCTFRDTSSFVGFGFEMKDCTFEGAPIFVENSIGYFTLQNCIFRGPAAALATVNPRDESDIVFDGCTFSGAHDAIATLSRGYPNQFLLARRSRFENLSGAALRHEFTEPLEESRYYLSFRVVLIDCSISEVEHAVWCRSTHLIDLGMARDTISSCGGIAIDATLRSGGITGLDLRDAHGGGVRLTIQNYFPWPHAYDPSPPVSFELRDSRIRDCAGDGIRIEQAPNPVWHPQHLAMRNSTIESNGGAGITFEGAQPTVTGCLVRGNGDVGILAIPAGAAPACSLSNNTVVENQRRGIEIKSATRLPSLAVDHNLVTNNRGGGIAVLGAFRGAVAMNDVFANGGAAFSGPIPHGVNLEVDPLYCEALTGDFHVRQDSPCGVLGPFGIIGAFGIGCLPPSPVAEMVRLRSPLGLSPNPARGPVTFAWTSGAALDAIELFDVQGRRRWNAAGASLHSGAVHWNGSGIGGERLPAGIYLVRWRAGDRQGSSRLVLLDP